MTAVGAFATDKIVMEEVGYSMALEVRVMLTAGPRRENKKDRKLMQHFQPSDWRKRRRRLVEADCCMILDWTGSRSSRVPSGGVLLSRLTFESKRLNWFQKFKYKNMA